MTIAKLAIFCEANLFLRDFFGLVLHGRFQVKSAPLVEPLPRLLGSPVTRLTTIATNKQQASTVRPFLSKILRQAPSVLIVPLLAKASLAPRPR